MSKLDDLRNVVAMEIPGTAWTARAEIERTLEEAEDMVYRAEREISKADPKAMDWMEEWLIENRQLRKFLVQYCKGEAHAIGTWTGAVADAMSAYAERGLE